MAERPSARSLRGLDGLNFLMADVRDGLGPYLAVFLKGSQHWAPGDIGIAMAVNSLAAAVAQIPAGLLVDGLRAKRLLVAGSGLAVAVGCLLIVFHPGFWSVISAQILIGAASAIIPPALAAISLGLVGRKRLDARISRNESFNHGGNFAAAMLAGGLGQWLGYDWIFYLVCAFAAASAAIVNLINSAEIDHELARGSAESADATKSMPLSQLWRHTRLLVFLASVILFHTGNAAMLPMAGQELAQTHPGTDTLALSICILAAQFVMIFVAWAVGRATRRGIGRKPIYLLALAVLPVRGLLFAVVSHPVGVVLIQLLDGVAAGIFGVVSILIAADLMRGTGRFNLAQGLMALAIGIGAAISNVVGGYAVQALGYPPAFLLLAGVALLACLFVILALPETRPERDAEPQAAPGLQDA